MTISEIKSQLMIKAVLDQYGLKPDKNQRLVCPWHSDKTPSLQIYPKTNTWTCFSSNCSAGSGDAIDFIMNYEKITKHEALIKAQEILGVPIQKKEGLSDIDVLTKYYQNSLHSMQRSKKGSAYMESRNLTAPTLQIGYCGYEVGKTWKEDLKDQAEKLGLFKIKNCLIFPMKNKDGNIVSLYGRSIANNPKVRHFYLQGGYKGLYPNYPKSSTKRLILTESIIDASTLLEHLKIDAEIIALYGTNGWTKEHESAIKNLSELEEVILFFDGDEAGESAIKKYHKLIQEFKPGIKISYVETPSGEDINSLVIGHDPMILEHLINQRTSAALSTRKLNSPSLNTTQKIETSVSIGILNTEKTELITYETTDLFITILGGIKITGLDKMKVTIKIENPSTTLRAGNKRCYPIRHSLDLYHVKQVEQLVQKVSESLEIKSQQVEHILSELTGKLEVYRSERIEAMQPKKEIIKTLSSEEKKEALNYLKDPKLLRNTLTDIAKTGIVGEINNSMIAYLTYTSRKREKPLHIMCLGASGIGKTYLQEKISALIPEEEKIEITSLSDNALYYFGRKALKQKLLLIEDLDGAQNALYPLREIQSKRRISKTVTLKDSRGKPYTDNLIVEGPVCVSSCTTRESVYEDNANRCILLYIDGSGDQDKRVMDYQKSVSSGKVNKKEESQITATLQNVQRLLQPIKIVNPYAELIDLPVEVFKPRRTLLLLLSFIETITFYHQYQRVIKLNKSTGEEYIESTRADIESAFSLLKEVLFTKSDELSKATRRFLERLKSKVKNGETFYTQEIRKTFRISSSSIHRYVRDLQRNGYIKYAGGNKSKGFEYEILDYEEYKKLQDSIDKKLKIILESIPVSQSYPSSENGINKALLVSDLD